MFLRNSESGDPNLMKCFTGRDVKNMGRSVGIIIIKIFFIQFFFQEKMVSMSTFYAPIISCDFPITSDPLSPRVYLLYKLIGSQRLRKAGTNPPVVQVGLRFMNHTHFRELLL